jgi:hypothetical protein
MEFTAPSGDRKSWLLRAESPAAGALAPPASAITSQVIDRSIYTIWYYMYFDPKGLRWRKDLEANFTNFTSARALEAYYGGQQRLASYQRTFQASDLDQAENEFRLLTLDMPQFVPGWMFLGITLVEKRSERDAIRAFDRAQQLLAPSGALAAAASVTERQTWLQARLFKANALLQMYNWEDNHEALRILEAAVPTIPVALPSDMKRQVFYDLSKIRFSLLFQTAHTVGHDLILLSEDNFVDALTEPPGAAAAAPTVPESVRPAAARQTELRAHENAVRNAVDSTQLATAKAQRQADFADEMTRIFNAQQALVARAENALAEIDTLVNDNTVPIADLLNKDEWKRDHERLAADLRNADGYARFRYAQLHESDDGRFREQCRAALAKLIEAQAARPNEYTIIQNMALIYGDPRYDPDGKELDTARALFARSLEIKSRDYFGYEKLATLAIRQAYERGVEFFSLDATKAAITQAEKARELRPSDGTIYALLAQLHTLKWSKTTGADQQEAASLVEAALALADRRDRANPFHVSAAQLQWQLARLRTSATKEEFDKAKTKLLAALHSANAEATGNPHWDARDLVARTTDLSTKLQNVEFDDRATLRWPD